MVAADSSTPLMDASQAGDPSQTGSSAARSGRPRTSRWLQRYPYVPQHDETDCAAACLAMIAAYYGARLGLAQLRDMANVSADGATLWSVARAAESLGFAARGLRLEDESLSRLHLPAIVHFKGMHYVVLYSIGRRSVVVGDPQRGRRRLRWADFLEQWTGVALELTPARQLTITGEHARGSLRRFLPTVRPHRGVIAEVMLASLLLSVLGLGVPVFMQTVIDRVLVNRSVDLLNMLLLGVLVLTVFTTLMKSLRSIMMVHVATHVDARLLADFFRHVFRLPIRFFDLRRVGDIVSRVSENRQLRDAMAGTIPSMMLDGVLALSYFTLLGYYNLTMALFVLATIPAYVLLIVCFTPSLKRNEQDQFEKRTDASNYLIESVAGMGTVKAMAAENHVRWQMEDLFVESMLTARKGAYLATAYSGLASLLQVACTVLFLWLGARQVLAGAMTVGQLLAFFTVAGNVVAPVLGLVRAWQSLQRVRNSVDRLNDVFDAEVEQDVKETLPLPSDIQGRIRLEKVTFSYQGDVEEAALREVSLEIEPGEQIAVVGRSGSGKTTLMKLLLGLYQPTQGRVSIDHHDLRRVDLAAIRRRVGAVPQDVYLFSGTVAENIALADPGASMQRIIAAAQAAHAHDFIVELGLGYQTKVGERGQSLSGGQRQRIALARALLREPAILLLDEATSALDNVSEREVQSNLKELARGRTTLIIAHRLTTVRHADRIVVMDEGRIVGQGTHAELLKEGGLYADLAGTELT